MILKRLLIAIPMLLLVSLVSFVVIQLPPGDILTAKIAAMEEVGDEVSLEQVEALRARYHLDRPLLVRYGYWMGNLLRGDMGISFEWNRSVSSLIGERLALTAIIAVCTILFTWMVAIPIGIYSALRPYSLGDYLVSCIGYVGMATPTFILALLMMYVSLEYFGVTPGGLFSPAYVDAPWSMAKCLDLLGHIWVPVVIIGAAGTAGMIRILRANLMEELKKSYVKTARMKGMKTWRLILKYPVRVAINPFISSIGGLLPTVVSGSVIISIILGLPTTGSLLMPAILNQDMYLAGSMVMLLTTLSFIGTLISDILLLILDPRIRLAGKK
jgi:peptide/nickel transport system permease protein